MLEEQLSPGQGAADIALSQGMAQPCSTFPCPLKGLPSRSCSRRTEWVPIAGQTLLTLRSWILTTFAFATFLGLQDFVFSCRCQAPSQTSSVAVHCMQVHSSGCWEMQWEILLPKKVIYCPETKSLQASTAPSRLSAGRGSSAGCQEGTACPNKKAAVVERAISHRSYWWKLTEGICLVF